MTHLINKHLHLNVINYKERETWNVKCKNKRWKVECMVHEKNMKVTV